MFLDNQTFYKYEALIIVLCFETDKLFFPLNSGENLGHLNY